MRSLEAANLIRIFDFYLAVMLMFGLIRRWQVYYDTVRLLIILRGRWPRLVDRIAQHKAELINWPIMRPVILALVLMLTQMIASRLIWPQATIQVGNLSEPWWQSVLLLVFFVPMVAVDTYFLIRVGLFNRTETEKYLDQAEKWSGTQRAKLIRLVTLGKIDPEKMVDTEVKKGLGALALTMQGAMWWVSLQAGLRLLFGLTIWLVWAIRRMNQPPIV